MANFGRVFVIGVGMTDFKRCETRYQGACASRG